jgi:FixJ family two-component response regulator
MTQVDPPTVYIVDDDLGVRSSLRALFRSVGVASTAYASPQEFLAEVGPGGTGCLLLDVRMPGMSGLELQRVLTEAGVRLPVIFITGHGDVPMAVAAMRAGAVDFVEKPFNEQQLLERVAECLKMSVEAEQAERPRAEARARLGQLTVREREILDHLVEGKPSKRIATTLGISEKTVDVHRSNIMRKTGARSIAELVRLWFASGAGDPR